MTISQIDRYVFNANWQWMVDNNARPQIRVDGTHPCFNEVPTSLRSDDMVLFVSMAAAPDLQVDDRALHFSTRFQGKSVTLHIPWEAISAMQTPDIGEYGIILPMPRGWPSEAQEASQEVAPSKRPVLTVIK